jgi:3-phosphoshikimate 1-carboxyvinyltransferase
MSVTVKAGQLRGFNVDVTHTPDLFPVYTVLGCYAEGMTKISGAARLRLKESDRLAVLSGELRKMGARIRELKDGLLIKGGYSLHGAHINPHSDHRVAMACAVAALGADEVTRIQNAECIDKSYPCFVRDLQALGATIWADCVR